MEYCETPARLALKALPFVKCDGEAIDLWAPAATSDWARDNATGRTMATALRSYIRVWGNAGLVGHIAKAIADKGLHGGVEVGFWHAIGDGLG